MSPIDKEVEKSLEDAAVAVLKAMLRRIREIMKERYRLERVSVKPIGDSSSRLSIPCKLRGTKDDKRKTYFAKILGPGDFVSSISIQFLKNIFLHMEAKNPIFEAPTSAEEMARFQYERLKAIRKIGVPTPRPYGFHQIDTSRWLLVVQWINAKQLDCTEPAPGIMEKSFEHLKTFHKNKIYHGDIKASNIMVGKKVYILDVGRFRDGVPNKEKQAYDLACMVCAFVNRRSIEEIIEVASKLYTPNDMKEATGYIGLIQRRPDFYLTDDDVAKLRRAMKK
jgi:tRNA A-37 threonylcarbamoyl transferase component Bud32